MRVCTARGRARVYALVYGGGIVVICLSHNCCLCQEVQLVTFGKLSLKTKPEQNWFS